MTIRMLTFCHCKAGSIGSVSKGHSSELSDVYSKNQSMIAIAVNAVESEGGAHCPYRLCLLNLSGGGRGGLAYSVLVQMSKQTVAGTYLGVVEKIPYLKLLGLVAPCTEVGCPIMIDSTTRTRAKQQAMTPM
eukprot:6126076-Amphidinium_carterae.1